MRWIVLLLLKFYKAVISPLFGFDKVCRYTPTCSVYTMEAVRQYGSVAGMAMGAWRIMRCNPFSKGGFDPVKENLRGKIKWAV